MNVSNNLKPSWSNDAQHSNCILAIIVVRALWNSCRTIVLLIDGKFFIKSKIVSDFQCLTDAATRGNMHGQYTDGSVTVTQRYYDSAIETNGSKSETVKVT